VDEFSRVDCQNPECIRWHGMQCVIEHCQTKSTHGDICRTHFALWHKPLWLLARSVVSAPSTMVVDPDAQCEGKYKGRTPYRRGQIQRLSAYLGPAPIANQLGVAHISLYRLLKKASPLR
jgi:hypothetical protein